MARVILLTGGNLGDVKSRLQCAQQQINEQIGPVLRCSHRYESRPWGFFRKKNSTESIQKS